MPDQTPRRSQRLLIVASLLKKFNRSMLDNLEAYRE